MQWRTKYFFLSLNQLITTFSEARSGLSGVFHCSTLGGIQLPRKFGNNKIYSVILFQWNSLFLSLSLSLYSLVGIKFSLDFSSSLISAKPNVIPHTNILSSNIFIRLLTVFLLRNFNYTKCDTWHWRGFSMGNPGNKSRCKIGHL